MSRLPARVPLTPFIARAIRLSLGLTQTEFAARIGYTQAQVSRAESGTARITSDYAEAVLWAFEEEVGA